MDQRASKAAGKGQNERRTHMHEAHCKIPTVEAKTGESAQAQIEIDGLIERCELCT